MSPGLNFCNRCGTKTNKEGSEKPLNPLSYLITALCIIGGGGLVLLVGLVKILLDRGANGPTLTFISIAYLMALFGICFLITRQISKLINYQTGQAAGQSGQEFQQTPQQQSFRSVNTAQLAEPRQQPISSVTEHTTRTLDEVVFRDR